jgi:ribose/xylose/arabinose/galactoside ABC-type transport system permease subunit
MTDLTLTTPAASRKLNSSAIQRLLACGGIYWLVVVLFAVGCFMSRDFLSVSNLLNTVRAVTLLGIVALGVSLVTYSGHYVDLSTPAIMALSGIVAVVALPLGFAAAMVAGIAAGSAVGLINGIVVGYLRLNPIIWTLAMMSIVEGLVRWAFSSTQVYPDATTQAGRLMLGLYSANLPGGIPLIVAFLGFMTLGAWALTHRSAFGAKLKLVGSNYETARMTGINVRAIVVVAFILSASSASVAGILLTSLNELGGTSIGTGYDFAAVTAVVLGGVTLAGGRGSGIGVLGGVLTIGLLKNIMTLAGFGTFSQGIVQGCVFIIAVGISSSALRRGGRDDS